MNVPILAFEKICKRFGAVVVAHDIDLALSEGEALGIIGPNGAGKSTLFGIASGTVQPDACRRNGAAGWGWADRSRFRSRSTA